MRDIIWTIIVLWFIYKIVEVLKNLSAKKNNTNNFSDSKAQKSAQHRPPQEEDIKKAVKNHLNNEGEYVDFEEVK